MLVPTLRPYLSYSYGITYGAAGIALVLLKLLVLPHIPADLKSELESLLLQKINYISFHFFRNSKNIGFAGDGQTSLADDFGAGGLGILRVLKLFKKYHEGNLKRDDFNFGLLPLINNKMEGENIG